MTDEQGGQAMRRTALALGALYLAAAAASAITYNVTTTADAGAGSLRQAITDANTSPGADTIEFNIVGSGVQTITLASGLPMVTDGVTINGYTQPGSSANTNPPEQGSNAVILIEINGAAAAASGLDVSATPVVVRGLAINRSGNGIYLRSLSAGAIVAGNFIGLDPAGAAPPGPQGIGVYIVGPANVLIGGTAPADRNVISGNTTNVNTDGVTTNLQIKGNLIGTDATGTKSTGSTTGVIASSATTGGTTPAERNVISGNTGWGVRGGGSVLGNYIGVDVSGTKPIPNATGVDVAGANMIVKGNVISANSGLAISAGGPIAGITIQGNFIGTDQTATLDLGNGPSNGAIQAVGQNWTIGGTGPGEGNVIAYNRSASRGAIAVWTSFGSQVRIRANRMFGNRPIAIDVEKGAGGWGVSGNDAGDADVVQNFPIIGTVTPGAVSTNIEGTLNSTASTIFDLDFFAGPACVSFVREYLQGENYLGSAQVTTDGTGNVAFSVDLPVVLQAGQLVSATATDPAGNTSEVSQSLVFRHNPGYGPPAGTFSSVVGMLFEAGATVTVGGVPAIGVTVVDPGLINLTAPALSPGSANDIVVTNPGGSSGTRRRGYIASFSDANGIGFDDVIATLVANQITAGCGAGIYCPSDSITRAQMAVFLLKGKNGICYAPPPATGTVFPDVPANSFAAAWVEALAAEGITGGCGGGNYCPGNPVTRQQMAVFLLKAEHGSTYLPPTCVQVFSDVGCSSPFAPWINRLAAEAITGGCGGFNYCPLNNATRGQMAAFIVKTFSLP
jgi:hypothetical protein